MKKNVLALSITAAVMGLGMAGGAQAMTGDVAGAAAGSVLNFHPDGIGHALIVPYYSAQTNNATLINLVNTDTVHGKAVKVRFRGAANSDDVFDFQVFLSPGDVYAFNISQAADGRGKLTTVDNSCTKPSKTVLNATPFVTSRLDPNLTTEQKANHTREGYVEIFSMADIPKLAAAAGPDSIKADGTAGSDTVNDLYWAIKHVSKVPPCSGAAWTKLDTTNLSYDSTGTVADGSRANGLLPPTTGLTATWTIINVVDAAAWAGNATTLQVVDQTTGIATTGNVVYWPQTSDPVGTATINNYTADPLMRTDSVMANLLIDASPAVTAAFYDLPDMSTPAAENLVGAAGPREQTLRLSNSLATRSIMNEFVTDSAIHATSDWVMSMPTRRYHVSMDYAAIGNTVNQAPLVDDGRRFNDLFGNTLATGYYLKGNTLVSNRIICVKGLSPNVWDREETTLTNPTDVVVSPSSPADPLSFCGEASVLSINNGGAQPTGSLKASVAAKDIDVTYVDGWMKIVTPSATAIPNTPNGAPRAAGLPMLGSLFLRAYAGAQSFGAAYAHRLDRN